MTSRARVQAVLRHETPDRLPIGLGGCETTGLHVLAYAGLRALLGLPPEPVRVNTFMFNAVFTPDVLAAMGGDILLVDSPGLSPQPIRAEAGWHTQRLWDTDIALPDGDRLERGPEGATYLLRNGRRWAKCPATGIYFDAVDQAGLFDEVPMPRPSDLAYRRVTDEARLRALEETARAWHGASDFALCCGETICDLQLTPGGMLNWYDTLLNDPDTAGEFLQRATDAAIEDLRVLTQALGDTCEMLHIAHDLGDRRGVTMGPDLFRRIYVPHYRRLFAAWHGMTRMKVNMHSCGAVADILGDLIGCGVDVINPVQTSCAGMDPATLKQRFGDRVVFYGGAYDAVSIAPEATEAQVYDAVREDIATLGQGGGYILAGVHNLPGDMPRAHLAGMLRAFADGR